MKQTNRSAARVEKQQHRARMDAIIAGLQAELVALNAAIRAGVDVRFPDRAEILPRNRKIERAEWRSDGIWVVCTGYGGAYAFGNDSRWAELLRMGGVPRDPRAV